MEITSLLHIVIVLIVLGIAFYVLQQYVLPHVAPPFNTLIIVILALAIIFWLLSLIGYGSGIRLRG